VDGLCSSYNASRFRSREEFGKMRRLHLDVFVQMQTPHFTKLPFEWYQYIGRGRPLPSEILPPSDLPSPVNGILWDMSELITSSEALKDIALLARSL